TAIIAVNAINDLTVLSPIALPDALPTLTGNVLTGAVDSEGAAITAVAGTFATANGSVTIASNGAYTYTPAAGYDGPDSFTFTALAGSAGDGSTVAAATLVANETHDPTVL